MAQYKVKVNLLNKRSHPVVDFKDKSNVVGTVSKDTLIEGTFVDKLFNGDWYRDTDGYYYWGGGIEDNLISQAYPWYITDFGIDEIWKETKGEGVTIIMLDSGFLSNPDLTYNRVKVEKIDSFEDGLDTYFHGTLMASIIAGTGIEIFGLAPSCQIISIKITNNEQLTAQDFIQGLKKVSSLIEDGKYYVVNCSLDFPLSIDEIDETSINELIDSLINRQNLIITSAVGNWAKSVKTTPAKIEGVISCAGLRKANNEYIRLTQSNYWEDICITTPGEFSIKNIKAIFSNTTKLKEISQGSSHACAYTTGIIALFLSKAIKKKRNFYFDDIQKLLISSSDKIDSDNMIYNQLNRNKLIRSVNTI